MNFNVILNSPLFFPPYVVEIGFHKRVIQNVETSNDCQTALWFIGKAMLLQTWFLLMVSWRLSKSKKTV